MSEDMSLSLYEKKVLMYMLNKFDSDLDNRRVPAETRQRLKYYIGILMDKVLEEDINREVD